MCIEFSYKKAGLPLVRLFAQSMEGILPTMTDRQQARLTLSYKLKVYKDGKAV